ncbi:MAG: VOC family protein [Terracidiphilus sp.]|jgi:uncharacterized glyoxalase superfamily protein PhnB
MSERCSTIIPGLSYRNAPAAIEWLEKVFGFQRHAVYEGPNGTIAHAELTLGNSMIMLGSGKDDEAHRAFKSPDELGGIETCCLYIIVPDADAAHARAVAAGANVTSALRDTPHGGRDFAVKDPEGHTWYVGTYDPWGKHE